MSSVPVLGWFLALAVPVAAVWMLARPRPKRGGRRAAHDGRGDGSSGDGFGTCDAGSDDGGGGDGGGGGD